MTGVFEETGYRPRGRTYSTPLRPSGPLPQKGENDVRCAAPGCGETPPKHCPFCAAHHFSLPAAYAKAAIRSRIACDGATTAGDLDKAVKDYRFVVDACLKQLAYARGNAGATPRSPQPAPQDTRS